MPELELQQLPCPRQTQTAAGNLLLLALESLRLGHSRVATQRILMLQASGQPLPDDLLAFCMRTWQRLSASERRRMRAVANAWADILQGRFSAVRPSG